MRPHKSLEKNNKLNEIRKERKKKTKVIISNIK